MGSFCWYSDLCYFICFACCRFPVQISVEVIKRRLENNYYRTVEAVKNDASAMVSFAGSYFGKSGDMANKMHRLSDRIEHIFSS